MTFEFDGKQYEKASAHQKEWGARLIAELTLAGNERILDLGCGDGKLTENLAALVPDGFVLGVDASRGMIDVAKQREKGNLSFRLLDINHLDISDTFDVVFSNATLHWVKDHRTLWKNLNGLLSDRGIVRFDFAGDGNCAHFFKVIRMAMGTSEYARYFTGFEWPWFMPSVEEYEAIVSPLSFSDVRIWGENADRLFTDRESIVGWINQPSIVPFLARVEESKKESFRSFVIDHMLSDTAQENGGYFETFRRINVLVRK